LSSTRIQLPPTATGDKNADGERTVFAIRSVLPVGQRDVLRG
jgi:hypothetical protein